MDTNPIDKKREKKGHTLNSPAQKCPSTDKENFQPSFVPSKKQTL
jgi:hypothetical protein